MPNLTSLQINVPKNIYIERISFSFVTICTFDSVNGNRKDEGFRNLSKDPPTPQSRHHDFWSLAIHVISSIEFDIPTGKAA